MANIGDMLAQYRDRSPCAARERLGLFFDGGKYNELFASCAADGRTPSVIAAFGYSDGCPRYAFAQDVTAESGAFDSVQAEKIVSLYELAARNGVPVVGFYDSHGAFVSDGAAALNAYSAVLERVSDLSGVVPTVSVISGICSGSMALIALGADITVMTEGSELYYDVSQKFTAEDAAKKGLVAASFENDAQAAAFVRTYLAFMPANNLEGIAPVEFDEPTFAGASTADEFAGSVADYGSQCEVYAEYGTAAYTAFATVSGNAVGICATNKTGDKLTDDDLSKLLRFVRLCDAYSIPVITLVDTQGVDYSGNAGLTFLRLSSAYAEFTAPKIAVIGKMAVGAVFTAFAGKNASADAVFAMPDSVIAPIAPVTAAEFLWHDELKGATDTAAARKRLADRYALENANAFEAARHGAVSAVAEGAELRGLIADTLAISQGKRLSKRIPRKHGIIL